MKNEKPVVVQEGTTVTLEFTTAKTARKFMQYIRDYGGSPEFWEIYEPWTPEQRQRILRNLY